MGFYANLHIHSTHSDGKYTPEGKAFDQGITCTEAIYNYLREKDYTTCGRTGEYANGNGGLMRIMPVCLYAYEQYKNGAVNLLLKLRKISRINNFNNNNTYENKIFSFDKPCGNVCCRASDGLCGQACNRGRKEG